MFVSSVIALSQFLLNLSLERTDGRTDLNPDIFSFRYPDQFNIFNSIANSISSRGYKLELGEQNLYILCKFSQKIYLKKRKK